MITDHWSLISPTISPFFTPDPTNKTTLMLIPNFMFICTCNSSCCYAACCSCHTGWWEKSSSAPYVYDQPFFHTSWPGLAWVPTQCRADIDLLMLQLFIISWHLEFKCTLVQKPNKSDKLFVPICCNNSDQKREDRCLLVTASFAFCVITFEPLMKDIKI